jgi:hypothetical protein
MTDRNTQLKDRLLLHKGEFTLGIKGFDMMLHGIVTPCKNGRETVPDSYTFRVNGGGYVLFDADDVLGVSRSDRIDIDVPKVTETT